MQNSHAWNKAASVQYKTLSISIVPQATAQKQYPDTRSPLSPKGNQERSLPDLTDIIEFLERIQCSHPSIQRIAIRLYSWAKGIDQRHLYRIASIRSERGAL